MIASYAQYVLISTATSRTTGDHRGERGTEMPPLDRSLVIDVVIAADV
jgi:hypothetical protein